MLDIKFIRENREVVEKAIADKNAEPVDLDEVIRLHDKRKELATALSEKNGERNRAADARDIEMGRHLKDAVHGIEAEIDELTKQFVKLMSNIPNIPSPDTPVGKDETENKILRQWGEKRKFSFPPKAHWDLGRELGVIDSERAGEISGARFTYLKGKLALLQFALVQWTFGVLTSQETLKIVAQEANLAVSTKPFIPVVPPVMMRSAVMNRMARLHPIDDRFYFEKDDLVLVGSAEHTLGPLHMDQTLSEEDLPIRYVGYSTAFRREAGSYGKDTKGILRQHQFDKMEMETFCLPEHSYGEQDFLVAVQEYLLRKLKLPYQAVIVCTGDMGKPNHRQIDIETWMPGQDTFRETHSADLMQGYQARRLNTRFRRGDGKLEHVHMNDATAFAIGRTLIAIMENYQQEDSSIIVPEVLRPYMGADVITKV